MKTLLTPCTYNVVRCATLGGVRYVAAAWAHEAAVLMATEPHTTYTDARIALDTLARKRGCALRWFDGEYERGDFGDLHPVPENRMTLGRLRENELSHSGDPIDPTVP